MHSYNNGSGVPYPVTSNGTREKVVYLQTPQPTHHQHPQPPNHQHPSMFHPPPPPPQQQQDHQQVMYPTMMYNAQQQHIYRLEAQNAELLRMYGKLTEEIRSMNEKYDKLLRESVSAEIVEKIDKIGNDVSHLFALWSNERADVKDRLEHIENAISGDSLDEEDHFVDSGMHNSQDTSSSSMHDYDQQDYFGSGIGSENQKVSSSTYSSSDGMSERNAERPTIPTGKGLCFVSAPAFENEEVVISSDRSTPGANVDVEAPATLTFSDPPSQTAESGVRANETSSRPLATEKRTSGSVTNQPRRSVAVKQERGTPNRLPARGPSSISNPSIPLSSPPPPPPVAPVRLLSPEAMRRVKRERVAHARDDDCPQENRCICGFRGKTKSSLTQHVQRCGAEEYRYKCIVPNCGMRFLLPNLAKVHLAKSHGQTIKELTGCKKCYKLLESKRDMDTHLNDRNEVCKDAPRRCPKNKSAARASSTERHPPAPLYTL